MYLQHLTDFTRQSDPAGFFGTLEVGGNGHERPVDLYNRADRRALAYSNEPHDSETSCHDCRC